jgi:hypothetical protein
VGAGDRPHDGQAEPDPAVVADPVAIEPPGGIAATLVIGAIAGLYPAVRAARLAPSEALATP